ncbi:MAG TPA: NAD(P)/FAD-dependent oxidoreductase [Chloroflexota bacterium]|nr:NAD(P)/FAD-dependent oxidoreductase [Chloroflexota bacterium]
MTVYDVVIAGAGPAGSTVAALLAGRGYRVLIIDQATFPREKACAEYCSPGVEDVLRRTGAWSIIAPEIRRVSGMTVFAGGVPVLPVEYFAGFSRRKAFTLPRITLDSMLLDHARASGTDSVERVRVTDAERRNEVWDIHAREWSGVNRSWTARLIVAADGLHSTLTSSLGIRSVPHWPRRLGLVTHYEGVAGPWGSGQMHVARGVYCGLAPLPGGLLNVGLVMSQEMAGARRQDRSLLASGIRQLPAVHGLLSSGRAVKPVRGMGPMSRRVDAVAGPGFLLVGDAAGFLDPFTGEGIYRALRGAELAVQSIEASVNRGQSHGSPDFSDYVRARREEFRAKERLTWLIQLALSRPALLARLGRNIAHSPETSRAMGNALGDIGAVSEMLRPSAIASLLIPQRVNEAQ